MAGSQNSDELNASLAKRLGTSSHVSPLRMKVERLRNQLPVMHSSTLEDWLVDLANTRGARIVTRPGDPYHQFEGPSVEAISNEELVVSICQLQCLDRPQMLRLAAQMVSAQSVEVGSLLRIAVRERVERVLAELSRNALRIDPHHTTWKAIYAAIGHLPPFRFPLLHWTRMAHPVPTNGICTGRHWTLVV